MNLYAIVGRLHGDDDDTLLMVKATDSGAAVECFERWLYRLAGIDYDDLSPEDPQLYITNTELVAHKEGSLWALDCAAATAKEN